MEKMLQVYFFLKTPQENERKITRLFNYHIIHHCINSFMLILFLMSHRRSVFSTHFLIGCFLVNFIINRINQGSIFWYKLPVQVIALLLIKICFHVREHSPRKKERHSKHVQDKHRHSEGHKSKHSSHDHKHHSSHRH